MFLYAGVGVICIAFLGIDLWCMEEGNISIDCGWQLPLYIDLMDILTNRTSQVLRTYSEQRTGIATCRGDGELIYRVLRTHSTPNEEMRVINVVVDSLQPWSNALSTNPASTIDVSKDLDR